MKLDFTTLFIVILLNSFGLAIVWAVISISYRSLHAARYWFAALAMTCLSGPALLVGENHQWSNYAGNLLVVLGVWLLWQGVRVFLEHPPLWSMLALMVTFSAIVMFYFGSSQSANNIIFATSQILPITLTLCTLLMAERLQAGIWIAAGGCGILILGQGSEAIMNVMRLSGDLTTETYYNYAAWFLVLAIIGITISNLGFLLMAVDKLRTELHRLATQDELTELLNRRGLSEQLGSIENKARRLKENVTVLMMDLDKFKVINDRYGHAAGDAALKHVADIAKNILSNDNLIARVGGDEFCIIMPNIDFYVATKISNSLRTTIVSTPFLWRGKYSKISASIGLIQWNSSSDKSLEDSLFLADEILIESKNYNNKSEYLLD